MQCQCESRSSTELAASCDYTINQAHFHATFLAAEAAYLPPPA